MRKLSLTHPTRQLFLVVAGFLVAIVLLESEGLASWANHLEIGPLRALAVPVTGGVQKALAPLGVAAIRSHALEELAHLGWSDDAALLAKAQNPSGANSMAVPGGCGLSGTAAAFRKAPGSDAPLASDVPRTTSLVPLPPVAPARPRVVALAGDSMMAVGISATLLRQAATDKNLHMVKAFRSGTGLSRPEVFNWMDEYPAMLGAEKPDVVIVAMGANDGQGFVVDGKVLAYGSDGWRKVYQDRLAGYLAMVAAGGARVVWLGLPPMRVPVYDEKIVLLNRIAYSVVSKNPGATWWNPDPYIADESGRFREFATLANGRSMRIRAADGIHLSDEGASLFTTVLMRWLDPPVETASVGAPAAPVSLAQAQPASTPRRHARRVARG
jgi:hypothetical protein